MRREILFNWKHTNKKKKSKACISVFSSAIQICIYFCVNIIERGNKKNFLFQMKWNYYYSLFDCCNYMRTYAHHHYQRKQISVCFHFHSKVPRTFSCFIIFYLPSFKRYIRLKPFYLFSNINLYYLFSSFKSHMQTLIALKSWSCMIDHKMSKP
jgi:hypothetical protein